MYQSGKWVFIINPVAGNGRALGLKGKIEEMVARHRLEADVVLTARKGHATELSRYYAANGFKYIIGVGGDGTMNEIVSPLIGRSDIVAGLIAGGTGNDFIQILGFSERFTDKDWDALLRAESIHMDIGTCNGHIFLNGMGLGFDAQVASENYDEEGNVREGWKYRYVWHIIKTLFYFREKRMTVIANGQTYETECFINTIANGRRFAGGFFLTPQAVANDGLLDVCAVKSLSLPERLRLLLMVPKGGHINDARVNYFRTDKVSLSFPAKVPFHLDGELYFADHFDVGVMSGAVNFIFNPAGNHFFRHVQPMPATLY